MRNGIIATGGGAVLPTVAFVTPSRAAAPGAPTPSSPYGPLSDTPDENGLLLPAGFTSRIIAVAGEPVGPTGYEWHPYPDGAATFDDGEGGWFYSCNSEVFDFMAPAGGGASGIHFASDGSIVDAFRILEGTNSNCGAGPTPWGTFLSGEENFGGQGLIWECDPTGQTAAVSHEAMGRFAHEAAAVDPQEERVYLTQDASDGVFYRFTPSAYPDLSAGVLEVCTVGTDGAVSWGLVTDPSGATTPTQLQVLAATVFPGNEGVWYHDGWVYFTSKFDHSVHGIDIAAQTYRLIFQGDPDKFGVEGAVLSGVDNITVDGGSGDLVVAEDGGNMELIIITPDGQVGPLVRVVDPRHEGSEMTGPVFNPSRDRLYFSSQRGPANKQFVDVVPTATMGLDQRGIGVTFEITGPFRGIIEATPETTTPPTTLAPSTTEPALTTTEPETTTTPVAATPAATTIQSPVTTLEQVATTNASPSVDIDDDDTPWVPIGIGVAAAVVAVGGALALRSRGSGGGSGGGSGSSDGGPGTVAFPPSE